MKNTIVIVIKQQKKILKLKIVQNVIMLKTLHLLELDNMLESLMIKVMIIK